MDGNELLEREHTVDLLLRYWGMGKKLDNSERDILMSALDKENKILRGTLHQRALERLRDMGIS